MVREYECGRTIQRASASAVGGSVEDLDLEELAADCEMERASNMAEYGRPTPPDDEANCYAFALIVQTTPIRGFTGSTVAPTAIR